MLSDNWIDMSSNESEKAVEGPVEYRVHVDRYTIARFDTDDEKQDYMTREIAFTRKELNNLYRAIKKDDREEAKKALTAKRREFYDSIFAKKKKVVDNTVEDQPDPTPA